MSLVVSCMQGVASEQSAFVYSVPAARQRSRCGRVSVGVARAAEDVQSHRDASPVQGEECDRLHRRLKRIVKARGALDLEEAAALREAQRLGIWRRYGYASLIEYMEMEMGYSPRVAVERLRVAHALVDLPKLAEAMEQGTLSFSGARELTRVATPETEETWLGATKDMNLRDVEDAVSGHRRGELPTDPVDPALKTRRVGLELRMEAYALWKQVRQVIEKERGERLDDSAIIEALAGAYLRDKAQSARNVAAYQIAVTVCRACKKGWQDGGNITVEMSPPAVERALCDAVHVGAIDAGATLPDTNPTPTPTPTPTPMPTPMQTQARMPTLVRNTPTTAEVGDPSAMPSLMHAAVATGDGPLGSTAAVEDQRPTRNIPLRIRRKVERRDHGRCQVPWCRSSMNCDIHHLHPWALGGTHDAENLVTLCEAHHLAFHDGTLSIRRDVDAFVFARTGSNAVTLAERAVETKLALRTLGFSPREVKDAVEKTRTHVGTQDLSIEQWIRNALDYCRKATMRST